MKVKGTSSTQPRRAAAFSLIELVVALAIMAALAAYALPSYREHVARAHRADAAMALYRAAQYLEAGVDTHASDSTVALPAGLDRVPAIGSAVYRLHVVDRDRANRYYAIEARPVEPGPMAGDVCGIFVLNAHGERTNRRAGFSRGGLDPACWFGRQEAAPLSAS